jgi:hypothetical protein
MKENCDCQKKEKMMVCTFFILLVVNGLIIWLANMFFPKNIALGTWSITKFQAIIQSMEILALIDVFSIPFIKEYETKRNKKMSAKDWMIGYFLINTASIWLIARLAGYVGMGISSWLVAVILGLILDLIQGLVMKLFTASETW